MWRLKWINRGTRQSPLYTALHKGLKITVWGYRDQWAFVVYIGEEKIAISATDKRYVLPGVEVIHEKYAQGYNAKRGAERWLASYEGRQAKQ